MSAPSLLVLPSLSSPKSRSSLASPILDDLAVLALPLTVAADDRQSVREAWSDLGVEKCFPVRLTDCRAIRPGQTEEELCPHPWLGRDSRGQQRASLMAAGISLAQCCWHGGDVRPAHE